MNRGANQVLAEDQFRFRNTRKDMSAETDHGENNRTRLNSK